MINADEVKVAVLEYFRYRKQYPLVALESVNTLDVYGVGLADVMAVTKDRRLIEVEVKVTVADFRRDKKKRKHSLLSDDNGFLPTSYFYFAVPTEIANKVAFECAQLYPYAGVLGTGGSDVAVYHRARRRQAKKLTLLQLSRMCYNQSGTVCRLARKAVSLQKELKEGATGANDKIGDGL